MNGITRTLARYASTSRFEALPAAVRHEGVRAFVNWAGCAAGAARDDGVQLALEFLSEFNGAATSVVVGRREKLDALNAAFVNSMSSAALAFNDTHFTSVAHPTSPVAAALLSMAQRQPVTGSDFIHALILGVEIQCRVGNILTVAPAECGVGLSMQGLVGGIGAAVAAGRILGLDESGMATAIGHAANQSGGLREAHATMGSYYIAGHAARCGLAAALLAARGYTCSDTMLEGVKGFAVSYGSRPNLAAAVDKLGEAFEILTLAYKPYPSGFVVHPVIDACLDAARNHAIDARQIERIELAVNPLALQLCNRPSPADSKQALVSFQHWAAVSLIYRAAGLAQVTEAAVHDPAVAELRRKVVATVDAGLGREAAIARIVMNDGSKAEASVAHCRGSAGRPLTDEDITEKTRGQLQIAFPAAAAEKILAECWRIEACPRVNALCGQLAGT
jgi:2-methylcitrate dehydratase PrpD